MVTNALAQNVAQAISDFDGIAAAIADKGVDIPVGTPTASYPDLIRSIQGSETETSGVPRWVMDVWNSAPEVEGYTKRCIFVFVDSAASVTLSNGGYFITSDGYSGGATPHTWDTSKDIDRGEGFKTRWYISYSIPAGRNVSLQLWPSPCLYFYGGDVNITYFELAISTAQNHTLEHVDFDECATTSLSDMGNVLNGCTRLKSITIPRGVVLFGANNDGSPTVSSPNLNAVRMPGGTVETLRANALGGAPGLETFAIPGGVKVVEMAAFGTGMKHVSIPASVISINNHSFMLCKGLRTVEIEDGWALPNNISLSVSNVMSVSGLIALLNRLGATATARTITLHPNTKTALLAHPDGSAAIASANSNGVTIA